jgi:hypothetical protein
MSRTKQVEGLVAQRHALLEHLRSTTDDGVVQSLIDLYANAVDEDPPPGTGLDVLEQLATRVERCFADLADERWDLPDEQFKALGGTAEMGIARLLTTLYRTARQTGAPTPPETRDAAVAALVWQSADQMEGAVHVVLDTGEEYVLGSGQPERTVRTDADTLLAVATGLIPPEQAPEGLEAVAR